MNTRRSLKKNGGPIIAVSRVFYNTRDRQKYIGAVGELVADMCECVTETGEPVATLYLHVGCGCGGVPIGGINCGTTISAADWLAAGNAALAEVDNEDVDTFRDAVLNDPDHEHVHNHNGAEA